MNNIYKYIYPYDKREQMKKQEIFSQVESIWNDKNYQNDLNFGKLEYIIRMAHEEKIKKTKNSSNILSRVEWGKYYEWSGMQREKKIKELNPKDMYKFNTYYGRTIENMSLVAESFKKDCLEQNIKISLQAALNIVYINVVDNTYVYYQTLLNTILNLESKFPSFVFELTDGLVYDNNAVDLFVYKDKELVGAIQVIPETKSRFSKSNTYKSEEEQKHEFFEQIYDFKPQIIHSSKSGYFENYAPSF